MQNENPERCGRACPSWVCLQTQNDTFAAASKGFERMMSLRTQLDNPAQVDLIEQKPQLDVVLGTGMRRSEQYRLTWEDINFERREIPLDLTKHGDGRVVQMNFDVVRAMQGLRDIPMVRKSRSGDRPNKTPDTAVFSLGDPKKWFGSATRRAKVKKFRWHDLRHTFCSRLAQRGVNLKVIQELAGHKSIATTSKYAHLDKKSLVDALALLNRDGD